LQKGPSPAKLLQHSSLVFSAKEVEQAIDDVARKIRLHVGDAPMVLICVMTGGLFFAARLMAKLNIPIEIDYVQASRYQHDLHGGSLIWTKSPSLNLQNKLVLIVDDILDEGVTLKGVKETCLQMGASQVITVALTEKNNRRHKAINADFIGLLVPDKFVFGCGMDVYGWWRNLPEIRALNSVDVY